MGDGLFKPTDSVEESSRNRVSIKLQIPSEKSCEGIESDSVFEDSQDAIHSAKTKLQTITSAFALISSTTIQSVSPDFPKRSTKRSFTICKEKTTEKVRREN